MLAVAIALRLLYPTVHVIMSNISKESFKEFSFLPFFPLQIAAGFALGFFTSPHFKSRFVMFVWVVPLVIILLYLCSYEPASVFQNRWFAVLSTLFGTSCRPPDCYDQVVVAAPLYAAAAFSFGSWARIRNAGTHSASAGGC
jgi:hypothetical protein